MRCPALLLLLPLSLPAAAAAPPGSAPGGPMVVGVEGTGVGGTDLVIATDLADVLNGPELRVVPIIGQGSVRNLDDLVRLRGVDVAVVHSDVLSLPDRAQVLPPGVERSVQHIAKLFDEEIHVLAGPDVHTLADLKGRPVDVDSPTTNSALTAHVLFGILGIPVTFTSDAGPVAAEKLKRGEIAAILRVAGKPAAPLLRWPSDAGLHFVPLPQDDTRLLQTYAPGSFTHADYPNLVPDGGSVDTLTTGCVLAVYAWAPGSEHYRRVSQFVSALFNRIGELQQPPAHPKWKEINLAAAVPNWTRFPPAAEAVQRAIDAPAEEFSRFLASGPAVSDLRPQQRAALLQQYLKWRRNERQ